eukprot:5178616-Prorocentrum_lima.AAC.1
MAVTGGKMPGSTVSTKLAWGAMDQPPALMGEAWSVATRGLASSSGARRDNNARAESHPGGKA